MNLKRNFTKQFKQNEIEHFSVSFAGVHMQREKKKKKNIQLIQGVVGGVERQKEKQHCMYNNFWKIYFQIFQRVFYEFKDGHVT